MKAVLFEMLLEARRDENSSKRLTSLANKGKVFAKEL